MPVVSAEEVRDSPSRSRRHQLRFGRDAIVRTPDAGGNLMADRLFYLFVERGWRIRLLLRSAREHSNSLSRDKKSSIYRDQFHQ